MEKLVKVDLLLVVHTKMRTIIKHTIKVHNPSYYLVRSKKTAQRIIIAREEDNYPHLIGCTKATIQKLVSMMLLRRLITSVKLIRLKLMLSLRLVSSMESHAPNLDIGNACQDAAPRARALSIGP